MIRTNKIIFIILINFVSFNQKIKNKNKKNKNVQN